MVESKVEAEVKPLEFAAVEGRRFIESPGFPVEKVNEASVKEKGGGGRPPYWEMVFWWTRKPLFSARAVIAGSLLPEMPDPGRFLYYLGARFGEGGALKKVPHRVNPRIPLSWRQHFEGKTLLDPFASFGSIPLEGMRMGLSKVVAVDFLPVAYIFLKAVLDYPTIYGSQLIEDVEKWGGWVTERLKGDSDVRELYDRDVAVYIGTWQVKCPSCGGYTPLVGNWWLARVKDNKGGWKALAWMKAKSDGGRMKVETVDLRELGDSSTIRKAIIEKHERRLGRSSLPSYTIRAGDSEWSVEEPNIAAGASYAKCLLCGNPIIADEETITKLTDSVASLFKQLVIPVSPNRSLILALLQKGVKKALNEFLDSSPSFRQVFRGKKGRVEKALAEIMKKEVERRWYIKQALNEWNSRLEEYLEGRICLEELENSEARPLLLSKVKIKDKDLDFEPAIDEDNERLWEALKKLRRIWGDPDIPKEGISLYSVRYLFPILYGMTEWYKLFNPRQILTLVKLVKLIREAGKKVEEEKAGDGLNKEEAFRWAEAVTTYLAIALCKYVDYNSVTAGWNQSLIMGHSLSMRGIAMFWNYIDINPFVRWTGSYRQTLNNSTKGLKYLISAVYSSGSEVRVLLDDAAVLNEVAYNEKFDLIVTDPPYRDDIPYTELSDLYFVWLKRALSNNQNSRLRPRFYVEPFGCFFKDGREIRTQWEEYRFKEISLNPPRLGESAKLEDGIRHYRSLMAQAFLTMYERLEDDGVLVTYFAHTHPDAWAELIEAGWRFAGFKMTNAFPIATESATSVISRGKLSLDTSIAVAWRKPEGAKTEADIREKRGIMLHEGSEWAGKVLGRYYGRDLFFTTFAKIISVATRYGRLTDMMGELDAWRLVREYVTPLTGRALVSAISGGSSEDAAITDPLGQFYLLVKILFAIRNSGENAPRRKVVKTNDIILLALATGIDKHKPREMKLVEKSTVRSGEYMLMEPMTDKPEDLEKLLRRRNIDTVKLEVKEGSTSPVDLLHMMGYVARSRGNPERAFEELRAKYPSQYSTAIALAKALIRALPEGDVERGLCRSLLLYIGV